MELEEEEKEGDGATEEREGDVGEHPGPAEGEELVCCGMAAWDGGRVGEEVDTVVVGLGEVGEVRGRKKKERRLAVRWSNIPPDRVSTRPRRLTFRPRFLCRFVIGDPEVSGGRVGGELGRWETAAEIGRAHV